MGAFNGGLQLGNIERGIKKSALIGCRWTRAGEGGMGCCRGIVGIRSIVGTGEVLWGLRVGETRYGESRIVLSLGVGGLGLEKGVDLGMCNMCRVL